MTVKNLPGEQMAFERLDRAGNELVRGFGVPAVKTKVAKVSVRGIDVGKRTSGGPDQDERTFFARFGNGKLLAKYPLTLGDRVINFGHEAILA